ncbi:hypothetical protein SEA_OTTAWA_12 [Arthrobacter phage Ottawa]|nr:hypothetical protein SEA_KHARCHO_12 [Arthrobacter phage Kharcho]WIC89244.1 hypothetical protein SEA_OTTAWA_12 [Arthrobacter phage Ottawa]
MSLPADPDMTFQTLYAEGENVRVVTYVNGGVASTILIDPDRAEALAGQYRTEAARARARKGARHDSSSSGHRERQQLEPTRE